MPFSSLSTLRFVITFVVSIVIGVALSPIVRAAPLMNDGENIAAPGLGYFLLVMILIHTLGFYEGWFNQTTDHGLKIRYWTWSTITACAGVTLGLICAVWPFTNANIYYKAIQVTTGGGLTALFVSLMHIAGQATWEKFHTA